MLRAILRSLSVLPRWSSIYALWIGAILLSLCACRGDGGRRTCANATCTCEERGNCNFTCTSPPCTLACEQGSTCSGACANGACACDQGANCEFACKAPPCHVSCGQDSTCTGSCANGECTCQQGASCTFACDAPPCHVTCDGDNASCDGTCADGTCDCGPGSDCQFRCLSGPCHTQCREGARCVVSCPNGNAGTQDCDISTCAAGQVTVCPGGRAITCNAPCPTTGDAGMR
jgi:hypothetical protein